MVEMISGILLKKITKSLELVWDGYYDGRHAFDFYLAMQSGFASFLARHTHAVFALKN